MRLLLRGHDTYLADAEQKAASLAQDEAKAADRTRLYRLVAPV